VSFDLFFGCFHAGQKATFPRSLLEHQFALYISRREPTCLTVDFGEGGTSYIYRDDLDQIESFSVNRPAAAAALYQAIFDLLRAEPLVLFMPGECPPLIGSTETAPQLPADMLETLGDPVVLKSANEILDWIRRT
jgi:hypothetical protein